MTATMTALLRPPRARPAYAAPATVKDAIAALGSVPGARPLAGGTDLMNALRMEPDRPPLVVDLTGVAGLRAIAEDGDAVLLGAGATMRAILVSPAASGLPALADAARLLGGRQIQAVATVGGNLCTASPAAETATPLLVHDAHVVVAGEDGERTLPLAELWDGPRSTVLGPAELLRAVRATTGGRSAYRRMQLRRSVDIALVSCAARLTDDGGAVTDARVAVGAVAPTPRLVPAAAAALVGAPVPEPGRALPRATAAAVAEAARACVAAAAPIDDVRASARYRLAVLEVVARRALLAALGADERADLAGHCVQFPNSASSEVR